MLNEPSAPGLPVNGHPHLGETKAFHSEIGEAARLESGRHELPESEHRHDIKWRPSARERSVIGIDQGEVARSIRVEPVEMQLERLGHRVREFLRCAVDGDKREVMTHRIDVEPFRDGLREQRRTPHDFRLVMERLLTSTRQSGMASITSVDLMTTTTLSPGFKPSSCADSFVIAEVTC